MSELCKYTIYFGTVDTDDAIIAPEVALAAEQGGDFECLMSFTPPHDEYEYMPEPEDGKPGPTWGEVSDHEAEYEDALLEGLDGLSGDFEEVLKEVMRYAQQGRDMRELVATLRRMNDKLEV